MTFATHYSPAGRRPRVTRWLNTVGLALVAMVVTFVRPASCAEAGAAVTNSPSLWPKPISMRGSLRISATRPMPRLRGNSPARASTGRSSQPTTRNAPDSRSSASRQAARSSPATRTASRLSPSGGEGWVRGRSGELRFRVRNPPTKSLHVEPLNPPPNPFKEGSQTAGACLRVPLLGGVRGWPVHGEEVLFRLRPFRVLVFRGSSTSPFRFPAFRFSPKLHPCSSSATSSPPSAPRTGP